MAATNVQAYRVYGDLAVQVGTGANNALETLGVTKDGGEILIQTFRGNVMSDVGGPEVPVERQDFGETARINVTLIAFNEDVLRRMQVKAKAGLGKAAAYGDVTPRGRCIGTDGGLFSVFFPPVPITTNVPWEESWYFPTVDLDTVPKTIRPGTVITEVRLSLFAFPFIPGNVTRLASLSGDSAYGKCYIRTNAVTAPSYSAPTYP